MEKIISGIQQIGVGIKDVKEAWKWYYDVFGVDIKVFEDETVAENMLPYTGNKPQKRHAALAMNLQGGGGFEIWQYTGRTPQGPDFDIQLGDYGIFVAKIKCKDVEKSYKILKDKQVNILAGPTAAPDGEKTFFITDPYGNHFQLVASDNWYKDEKKHSGSTYGAVIGVSDIDVSKKFYDELLGYDTVVYDKEGEFDDLKVLPGGNHKFRRVLLRHSKPRIGGFSPLLGKSELELVQVLDRKNPQKIYKDRYWGDLGFIHICFDISGMEALKKECREIGYPFTVDSNVKKADDHTFDMGEAAGHFAYNEDPDGTLIEFVETHKVPLIKKLGWNINLKKKDPKKPLPNWMIKGLSFSRIKF